MKPEIHFSQKASVTYTRSIVDSATGRTVKTFPPRRNTITDQGLNSLVSQTWQSVFSYLVLGTGTDPFKRDSGLTQFTRSGTTITADTNFFVNTDTGSLLKWDTGEECYITYVNATTATSDISGTVAAAEGTVYHVNRIGLQTEVKRTNTETTDSGDRGHTYNGTTGTVSLWRTLLASAEVGTVTYREVAWSHNGASGNNIFGGDLLPGGGDTLVAGQQYKIKIQLDIVISPAIAPAAFAALTPPAWPAVAGNSKLENVGIIGIASIGTPPWGQFGNYGSNEPSVAGALDFNSGSQALRAPNGAAPNSNPINSIAGTAAALVWDSYVSGSFTRTAKVSYSAVSFSSTIIRSITYYSGLSSGQCGYRLLLDADESKSSAQALNNLTIRKTWGRVLIN